MKALASALLLLAATSAFAGVESSGKSAKAPVAPAPAPECPTLSYKYGELGYLHQDFNGPTADGGFLELSHLLVGNLFFDGSVTVSGGDTDYTGVGAGVGYFVPLTDSIHLVGRTGYAWTDVDNTDVSEWYVSPGLRARLSCNLEAYVKAYYHVPESGENSWSGGAGLVYYLCQKAALDVGYAIGEDDNWHIQAGIRYNF
jgi:hypothetical protein